MKNTTASGQGWLSRISWRIKVAIAAAALVVGLLVMFVVFIAGMTTGYLFSQAGLSDDCVSAGGTWNESAKVCEMKPAPAAVTSEADGTSYRCDDGTRFALERTDPEAVSLTVDQGTPRILPLVGTGGEGSRYSDGSVSALLGSSSVSYADGATGVSTTCTLAS